MDVFKKYRLDHIDRRMLAVLESDARMPLSKLAKRSRVSRAVAEYRLRKLEEAGVVRGYYCLLDPSRFGLTVWKLWVSLQSASAVQRKEFFSYLESHARVWWYAECAGIYDAVICVLARSPHEFNTVFNSLQDRYGALIRDCAILINVSFEYHTRGYLTGAPSRLIGSSFQEKPLATSVSGKSLKLLSILSKNSRATYASLVQQTKLNVKTIKHLLSDLRSSGCIVYFRPSIDAAAFGYEYYKALLYLHNPRGGVLPSVVKWCRGQQNIIAAISCVGPWQLELEIEVDTFRNLCAILTQLKDHFPDVIRSYETLLLTSEGQYQLNLIDKLARMQ